MITSILTSTKKMLGIGAEYTHFDHDIIILINNAFFTLNQLGVGPDTPFMIEDDKEEWSDFITDGEIESVKSYVFMKAKQVFDPPANSAHLNALVEQIKELEWRMNVKVDPSNSD